MQNFVNAILDGEPLIAPGEEGIHSVELANVILYSSLMDKTIQLPMDSAGLRKEAQRIDCRIHVRRKKWSKSSVTKILPHHSEQIIGAFDDLHRHRRRSGKHNRGPNRGHQDLGWSYLEPRGVEVPGFPKANFHDIPDQAFDLTQCELWQTARIGVYCFGSTIMNWSKNIQDAFELTLAEVKRAIPRMQRLGTKYVRIMSFKPGDEEYRTPTEVFRRVRDVTNMFLDAGLQPVHENCMNYGGMSWQHALELLDRCPGLKWVFDTANPIFNPDRSKSKPWPKQDPWEFWEHVRDHVVHIHVKDATWNPAKNDADYNWPGEGQGRVEDILADAISRGYRRRDLNRTPHGRRIPRQPVQSFLDRGDEQKLRRIRETLGGAFSQGHGRKARVVRLSIHRACWGIVIYLPATCPPSENPWVGGLGTAAF